MSASLEDPVVAIGLEKVNKSPRRVILKNVLAIGQLHSSPTLSKVILKILHAGFQHYVNQELPDIQGGFRKGGTRDQSATFTGL